MIMDFIKENLFLILIIILFIGLFNSLPSINRHLRKRKFKKLMVKSGIRDIDRMDGFEFEAYLEVLFSKLGYKAITTKKSGDFGADLILKGKNKIVIQAKRYGYKNRVSLDAVREVYASQKYYDADECWVITNSFFTKQAKELATACDVKLLDRYDLQKFIVKINPEGVN